MLYDTVQVMADKIFQLEQQMHAMKTFGFITDTIMDNKCLLFNNNEIIPESSRDYRVQLLDLDDRQILPLKFLYSGKVNECVLYLIDQSDWKNVKVKQLSSSFKEKPKSFHFSKEEICRISGMTEEELALKHDGKRLVCWINGCGDLTFI